MTFKRVYLSLPDFVACVAGGLIGFGVALAVLNELARRHFGEAA